MRRIIAILILVICILGLLGVFGPLVKTFTGLFSIYAGFKLIYNYLVDNLG